MTMKTKAMIFGLFGLLCIQPHAMALMNDGNGTSGGGNALRGQMIEQYLVVDPYAELPGLKETITEFTTRLAGLPDLAQGLTATIQNQDWYLIPQKIRQLPDSVTGLHFETQQVAYQDGKEIFIDKAALLALSPDQRSLLYKHETLMAALELQDQADKVRELLAFMKKHPTFTTEELRLELVETYSGCFADIDDLNQLANMLKDEAAEFRDLCLLYSGPYWRNDDPDISGHYRSKWDGYLKQQNRFDHCSDYIYDQKFNSNSALKNIFSPNSDRETACADLGVPAHPQK